MLTKKEKQWLSLVATDLLTGNYLLGRPRENGYIDFLKEFCAAVRKCSDINEHITNRDVVLIREMAPMFYGGFDDMCDQLIIGEERDIIKKRIGF